MLSLREVRRAAEVLKTLLAGTRLQRIVQPDEFGVVLEFYGHARTRFVLLKCHPQFARVSVLQEMPKAPSVPPAFVQYARANFLNASFERVTTSLNDRRLGVCLAMPAGAHELLLSILGPRSNVYLLDRDGILVYSVRPLAETRRALVLGSPWTDPEGGPKSEGQDRWEHVADSNYLEAIEETYAGLELQAEAEMLARRLESALSKEAESLERKALNIQEDLGEAIQAENYRRQGELLKGVLHTIRSGSESIQAIDFETGSSITILLDPRLSPAENLTSYFKRYQKELRGARILGEQLQKLRKVQEGITGYQARLNIILGTPAPDFSSLQALAAEPRVRKWLNRYFPAPKTRSARPVISAGRKEIPSRLRPKRFRTDQGLEIWVGRSEEGNDHLTMRLARGNDIFFHLEGYPGSHVILRTEGKTDPPAASLLDACELAVHFSKLKDSRQADVHMAPVKNVRKPKGSKPGLVYVSGGKTVHLRRDPNRLQNILAARLDE